VAFVKCRLPKKQSPRGHLKVCREKGGLHHVELHITDVINLSNRGAGTAGKSLETRSKIDNRGEGVGSRRVEPLMILLSNRFSGAVWGLKKTSNSGGGKGKTLLSRVGYRETRLPKSGKCPRFPEARRAGREEKDSEQLIAPSRREYDTPVRKGSLSLMKKNGLIGEERSRSTEMTHRKRALIKHDRHGPRLKKTGVGTRKKGAGHSSSYS